MPAAPSTVLRELSISLSRSCLFPTLCTSHSSRLFSSPPSLSLSLSAHHTPTGGRHFTSHGGCGRQPDAWAALSLRRLACKIPHRFAVVRVLRRLPAVPQPQAGCPCLTCPIRTWIISTARHPAIRTQSGHGFLRLGGLRGPRKPQSGKNLATTTTNRRRSLVGVGDSQVSHIARETAAATDAWRGEQKKRTFPANPGDVWRLAVLGVGPGRPVTLGPLKD